MCKDSKNKYDEVMLETAKIWSNLSYCNRRKVGAVIAKDNVIISNGYNGTHSGKENNCEYKYVTCNNCNEHINVDTVLSLRIGGKPLNTFNLTCDKCKTENIYGTSHVKLKTSLYVVHAEQNAIANASKNGISIVGATLYSTTLPCPECSKIIVSHGIKRVVYEEDYKDNSTIDFLKDSGLIVDNIVDLRIKEIKEHTEE